MNRDPSRRVGAGVFFIVPFLDSVSCMSRQQCCGPRPITLVADETDSINYVDVTTLTPITTNVNLKTTSHSVLSLFDAGGFVRGSADILRTSSVYTDLDTVLWTNFSVVLRLACFGNIEVYNVNTSFQAPYPTDPDTEIDLGTLRMFPTQGKASYANVQIKVKYITQTAWFITLLFTGIQ